MPKAKQLTIRVADRPGVLGEVAWALWEKGINIQAFQASEFIREGQGAIHLVVDKHEVAREVLAEHGWIPTEEEIVALTLADKPGSLAAVARKLGEVGINIHYAYTGPAARAKGKVSTYLAVTDLPRALEILG